MHIQYLIRCPRTQKFYEMGWTTTIVTVSEEIRKLEQNRNKKTKQNAQKAKALNSRSSKEQHKVAKVTAPEPEQRTI